MASNRALFDQSEFVPGPLDTSEPAPVGKPRLRVAERRQMVFHPGSLDDLIPEDHVARSIWAYVCGLISRLSCGRSRPSKEAKAGR